MADEPLHIIVDSREQLPYGFNRSRSPAMLEFRKLDTGDYSLPGYEDAVAIERKSLGDIIGCLTVGRERFEKELERAKDFKFFAVVIEASMMDVRNGEYRSQMNSHAAFQSLFAFQVRYGVHVVWASTREGGEYATYSLLQKYKRETEKGDT